MLGRIGNILFNIWRIIGYIAGIVIMLFILNYSTLPQGDEWTAVGILSRSYQFDYLGWEAEALTTKAEQTLYGVHPFMDEDRRSQYIRDYMSQLGQAESVEGQIDTMFADPQVSDPETASADLRAQRDTLRADLRSKQPLVESILEGQVAAVLVEQGFGLNGQLLPPIAMHFTQVPNLLVVSPRDKIETDVSINLNPMTVDDETALESKIDRSQNVSSLVVPLGGLALYPAMVLETTSIQFVLETFSHEWLHNYLFFYPLGLNYDFGGETQIINETTANLFGREVGRLVLERYYPDLMPPNQPATPPSSNDSSAVSPGPPPFDFGGEMRETRVVVDQLLSQGEISEAYFAFYGNYQSAAPGEGGSDPIGPAVQAIREASPSIHAWIVTMETITTREQLLAVREAISGANPATH
jgi:hypothetical protein